MTCSGIGASMTCGNLLLREENKLSSPVYGRTQAFRRYFSRLLSLKASITFVWNSDKCGLLLALEVPTHPHRL